MFSVECFSWEQPRKGFSPTTLTRNAEGNWSKGSQTPFRTPPCLDRAASSNISEVVRPGLKWALYDSLGEPILRTREDGFPAMNDGLSELPSTLVGHNSTNRSPPISAWTIINAYPVSTACKALRCRLVLVASAETLLALPLAVVFKDPQLCFLCAWHAGTGFGEGHDCLGGVASPRP